MTKRRVALLLLAVSTTYGCAAPAADDESGAATQAVVGSEIANGEHPEVMLLRLRGRDGASSKCTGTLVAPHTVLTDGSCVETVMWSDGVKCTGEARVDTAGHGATTGTRYLFERCARITGVFQSAGLIRLTEAVSDVKPAALYLGAVVGKPATIYGYGDYGGPSCPSENVTNDKRRATFRFPSTTLFQHLTCPGDEGAPAFIGNAVAAVFGRRTSFPLPEFDSGWLTTELDKTIREFEK